MCKLSLLVSAIMLAATVNARANTVTNITFNNFCDGMQLQTADGKQFSSTETGACLQGVTVSGSGVSGGPTSNGPGGLLTLIVNWARFEGKSQGAARLYFIQYPFVPGGTWEEFIYQPGHNCPKGCGRPLNEGAYSLQ